MNVVGRVIAALVIWSAITLARSHGFDSATYLRLLRQRDALDQAVLIADTRVMQLFSTGYSALLADTYYMEAVQYFGEAKYGGSCYPQLADLLQVALTLDPHLYSAYRFAGDAIPCNDGKRWIYGDRARDLLLQGIQVYPNDWQLRLRLGYVYTALLHEHRLAAEQFAAAAKSPDAPPYFGALAARLMAVSGDLDSAILVTEQLLQSVENERAQETLKNRLAELYVERDLEVLNRGIEAFKTRTGLLPSRLQDLVGVGILPEVPKDPWGGDYSYDVASGKATSKHLTGPLVVYGEE